MKENCASDSRPIEKRWVAGEFKMPGENQQMKKKSPGESGYASPRKPWCPDCRAHREISLKGDKQTCAACGKTKIFNPQSSKIGSFVFTVLAVFCALLTVALSFWIFIPGLLCGFIAFGYHIQREEWAKWARENRARRRKEKRKHSKKKKRREKVKDSPPTAPKPPPLPPDADDED